MFKNCSDQLVVRPYRALFLPITVGVEQGDLMDAADALAARRQVRDYTTDSVSEQDLAAVLDAGRRSASSRNSQRWDFVVVTDEETKSGLAQTWQGAGWIPGAPVVVGLVVPTDDDVYTVRSIEYDLGQAVTSMIIAATSLGLGTGQTACRDQDLARSLLGFPESHICSKLFTVGHPADRPMRPLTKIDRRPIEDVVHRDRW